MTTPKAKGARPRPNCFVQVDLTNAYARLGVSPLASVAEIKRAANDKQRELRSQLRRRSEQTFGAVEGEIDEILRIEELIGSPKARERYDQEHPQNELLTVQAPPRDLLGNPQYRSGVITAWIAEELGVGGLLPSVHSIGLWALNSELIDKQTLAPYAQLSAVAEQASSAPTPEGDQPGA